MSTPTEVDRPGAEPEKFAATASPEHTGRGRLMAAVVGVVILAALLAAVIVLVVARDDAGPKRLTITIPAGTGERIAEAEAVNVVDPILRLDPGQELVVRNNDVRLHALGPISIPPGATGRQAFPNEGRYPGATSLREDGRIAILVENN